MIAIFQHGWWTANSALAAPLLAQQAPAPNPLGLLPGFAIVGILFYFMLLRPQIRRQKELKSQVEQLKKNDRVVTIGGIYGTVMSIDRDANEVVLKVDESTGAKLRCTLSSVERVISDEAAAKPAVKEKD